MAMRKNKPERLRELLLPAIWPRSPLRSSARC
jgi:hypothetical protein